MLAELIPDIEALGVTFHLAEVKGPVRDVMHRAGLWEKFDDRIHASTCDVVLAIRGRPALRRMGVDER